MAYGQRLTRGFGPTMEQHRLAPIDALRGIAALCVAIMHFYYNLQLNVPFPAAGLLIQHFGYPVELFFLISAFTMMYTFDHNETNRVPLFFLIKRYFRIAPLFYFCMFISFIIFTWSNPGVPFPHNQTSLITNILLLFNLLPQTAISMTPAGWTIGVEIIFYLLFPLIAVYAGRRWFIPILLLGFSALAYISRYQLPASGHLQEVTEVYFINFCTLNFMPVFIAGILLYNVWKYLCANIDVEVRRRIGSWCMYAFLAFTAVILSMIFPYQILHYIWAAAYMPLIMAALLNPNWFIVNRFTTYLGKISYSVYLLHDLVIGVLLRLVALGLFSRIENPAIRSPLLVLIGFSALFPISALSYRFLEAPCNRFAVWLIGQIRNRRAQATMASLQIFQLQDKINSGPGLKIEKIEN
jgi:peptidoglycan/LPS O-acetylase OafA/YrhL